MAKNRYHENGDHLDLTVGSGTVSGDPVLVGQIPGVAVVDRQADGRATVQTNGVYLLSVKGENNAGNTAVAEGDILYYEAAATPKLNKDNVAGVRYGYALEAIASGATATIKVKVGY